MAETIFPSSVASVSASASSIASTPTRSEVEKRVPSFHQLFELLHDETIPLEEALKTFESWWQPTFEQAQIYQRIQRKEQKKKALNESSGTNHPTPTRSMDRSFNVYRTSNDSTKRQRTSLGGGSNQDTNDRNRMNRFGGSNSGSGAGAGGGRPTNKPSKLMQKLGAGSSNLTNNSSI